ncbi:MAG: hypothetical protein ACOC5D_04305 [Thermoplasmatota archaeon]
MNNERVTGVIPDLRTGMFGRKSYSLVVSNQRLIFAEVSTELMNQEREKAVSQSNGFMGRWKASVASGFTFHERYYDMDPDMILRESPENFEIRPEQIKSVKLKGSQYGADQSCKSYNKMLIKWTGGKDKYNFQKVSTGEVKKALTPLLGSKVK